MAKPNQANPSKNSSKKKKKITSKKLLSGPNAVAMKTKPSKENPFENIWSRGKFDALGKKRKGEQKRTGLARSRAIEKRKGTLLKEYEQSGKASVFVDKRIGEQNEELGEYDKALLRFQRERQLKLSKKSKFNLSDGEEDQDGGFTERDDFEDDMSPYDDADESGKKSDILKQLNAHNVHNPSESGSMEGEENKHKSKKEVMEEIILKSKFYKAEKAKDKEENELLMDQLDQNFASLVQSKALVALTQPSKMNALKALLNKGKPSESTKKDKLSVPAVKSEPLMQDKPDAYDKLVKEMTLDMRARPSERTKTPEEIAQEERERLERLEEERQKRMLGADDSSDEGSDGNEDVKKLSAQKLRSLSGDDLGDSFNLDEDTEKKKSWLVKMFERGGGNSDNDNEDTALSQDSDEDEGEGEDEDEDEDEDESDQEDGSDGDDEELGKTKSLKDWEQSDDDNLNTDSEEDTDEEDEVEEIKDNDNQKVAKIKNQSESTVKKAKSSGKQSLTKLEALPFVIEAPNSLEELCSLLENRSDTEVIEAVNRIRACNGVKLAAENRKKMQVFYGILLQYFAVLATKKPLKVNLLNLLVKPLVEMCGDTPYFAAICARQRILRTRTQFCEDVKNPEKSCWPSLKTLLLLRLWSVTFPCSDFRHVVMTPALLLMSEYLIRCPITSGRDIAIGSFLCSMVLSVSRQSKKFCPEAIIFLRTLLMSASETEAGLLQHSQLCYFSELKMLKPWLRLRNRVSEIHPLDFFTVMTMPEDSPVFSSDSFRASVLVSVIEALRGFVNISEEYNSFPEIFLPISSLLQEVAKQENMPNILQDNIKDLIQLIEKKADEKHLWRQPLQMRKLKIVQIKQSNLKIEENFAKGRDYDPDRERAERRKLKKLLKQESKGAIRELRKDNYFLLEVKQKENAALQEERAEKSGKARAFLQEQEHAFKSGQLGKNKKRRR